MLSVYLAPTVEVTLNGVKYRDPYGLALARTCIGYVRSWAHIPRGVLVPYTLLVVQADDFAPLDADSQLQLLVRGAKIKDALDADPTPRTLPLAVRNRLGVLGVDGNGNLTARQVLRRLSSRLEPALTETSYEDSPAEQRSSITDDFNRANGALGSGWTEVYNFRSPGVPGATPLIVSNHVEAQQDFTASMWRRSETSFPADHYAQVKSIFRSGDPGSSVNPMCRVDASTGSGYTYTNQSTTYKEMRRADGETYVYLTDGPVTQVDGVTYTTKIQATGSSIALYFEGSGSSFASATDSTYATGKPGMRVNAVTTPSDSVGDDWEGTDALPDSAPGGPYTFSQGTRPTRKRRALTSAFVTDAFHTGSLFGRFLTASAGGGGITADLSKTEASDTLASAATLAIAAALTRTEANDTSTSAAALAIAAALSSTEAGDTLTSAAALAVAAALTRTEASDTLSSTAGLGIAAALTSTEASDTLVSAATLGIAAALTRTEANDTPTSAGVLGIVAVMGATEANDTLTSAAGDPVLIANLSKTEDSDRTSLWKRGTNPILSPGVAGPNGKIAINIADGHAFWDVDHWKLYFASAYDHADVIPPTQLRIGIGLAKSFDDGATWSVATWNCLLPTSATGGASSDWDYTSTETPTVVLNPDSGAPASERYVMYYSGANITATLTPGGNPVYRIGLAFSADGLTFTRVSAARSPYATAGLVLDGSSVISGSPSLTVLADPTVITVGTVYLLWFSMISYSGSSVTNGGICEAISLDGITWIPEATNPLPSLYRSASVVAWQPTVINNGSTLEMLFTADSPAEAAKLPYPTAGALGYWRATSSDGVTWTPDWSRHEFSGDLSASENQNLITGVGLAMRNGVRKLFYSAYTTTSIPPALSAYPVVWKMNMASQDATAQLAISAALTRTEASDTLTSAAALGIAAALTRTEASDTLACTAALAVAAALTRTEASDTLTSGTAIRIGGQGDTGVGGGVGPDPDVDEANDSLSSTTGLRITAALSAAEAGDTLSSSANTGAAITAVLTIQEAGDTLLALGTVSQPAQPVAPTHAGGGAVRKRGRRGYIGVNFPPVTPPMIVARASITEEGDVLLSAATIRISKQERVQRAMRAALLAA